MGRRGIISRRLCVSPHSSVYDHAVSWRGESACRQTISSLPSWPPRTAGCFGPPWQLRRALLEPWASFAGERSVYDCFWLGCGLLGAREGRCSSCRRETLPWSHPKKEHGDRRHHSRHVQSTWLFDRTEHASDRPRLALCLLRAYRTCSAS